MTRLAVILVIFDLVVMLLIFTGCTTAPKFPPLPPRAEPTIEYSTGTVTPSRPPQLAWEACHGRAYFVNYAPFSVPDIYIVIAGPLLFTGPEMIWQTEEQGLYAIGAEGAP